MPARRRHRRRPCPVHRDRAGDARARNWPRVARRHPIQRRPRMLAPRQRPVPTHRRTTGRFPARRSDARRRLPAPPRTRADHGGGVTTASFPVSASIREARPQRTAIPLALAEGRRLVLHPLTVVGLALTIVVTLLSLHRAPGTTFDAVTAAPTFYFGVFVILAANLIATRDGRSGAIEMLTPAPTPTVRRTLALIIAAAFPAGCCAVIVLLADAYLRAAGRYVVAPSGWYLAQSPLTIFGAGLLGILVARWLPYRAAPYLVVITVVIGNIVVSNHPETL